MPPTHVTVIDINYPDKRTGTPKKVHKHLCLVQGDLTQLSSLLFPLSLFINQMQGWQCQSCPLSHTPSIFHTLPELRPTPYVGWMKKQIGRLDPEIVSTNTLIRSSEMGPSEPFPNH